MPGKRISELTALSGANSANNDDVIIFDTTASETKRISRSQLAEGMIDDLPFLYFHGVLTADPTQRFNGDSLALGDGYLRSSDMIFRYYTASGWQNYEQIAIAAATAQADRAENEADRAAEARDDAQAFDDRHRRDVPTLLADTTLTYTAAQPGTVIAGDVVRTRLEGYAYEVAASGATDQDVTTAGGVKLYVLPDAGSMNVRAFGAIGDGVADDTAEIKNAIAAASLSARRVFFPAGTYYITETLNIKQMLILEGEAGSIVNNLDWPTKLVFADGIVGIFLHRLNTDADATGVPSIVASTFGADGTIVRNLYISRGDGSRPATFNGKHGVWAKSRFVMENCLIQGFGGENLYVAATASATTDPLMIGNANNYYVATTRLQNAAGRGFHCIGADVNVGVLVKVDSSSNGRQGFLLSDFLGTTLIGPHTSGNGKVSQVSHLGNRYYVLDDVNGGATEPGTDPAVWELVGAGGVVAGTYPAWVSGTAYFRGSAYETTNANAPTVLVGPYTEGSQPLSKLAGRVLRIGGAWDGTETGSLGAEITSDSADGLRALNAVSSYRVASDGAIVKSLIGSDPNNGDIIRAFQSITHPLGWRLRFNGADMDFRYSNLAAAVAYSITGPQTTNAFGGVDPVLYAFGVPKIAIGAGSNARLHTTLAAAPTTGDHARGEVVYNRSPTAGGYIGWVCVTGGTPGTWKEFGAILA